MTQTRGWDNGEKYSSRIGPTVVRCTTGANPGSQDALRRRAGAWRCATGMADSDSVEGSSAWHGHSSGGTEPHRCTAAPGAPASAATPSATAALPASLCSCRSDVRFSEASERRLPGSAGCEAIGIDARAAGRASGQKVGSARLRRRPNDLQNRYQTALDPVPPRWHRPRAPSRVPKLGSQPCAETGPIGQPDDAYDQRRAGVAPPGLLDPLRPPKAGEQQPVLSAAVMLADALGISLTQLAGQVSYDLDLSGELVGRLADLERRPTAHRHPHAGDQPARRSPPAASRPCRPRSRRQLPLAG